MTTRPYLRAIDIRTGEAIYFPAGSTLIRQDVARYTAELNAEHLRLKTLAAAFESQTQQARAATGGPLHPELQHALDHNRAQLAKLDRMSRRISTATAIFCFGGEEWPVREITPSWGPYAGIRPSRQGNNDREHDDSPTSA